MEENKLTKYQGLRAICILLKYFSFEQIVGAAIAGCLLGSVFDEDMKKTERIQQELKDVGIDI